MPAHRCQEHGRSRPLQIKIILLNRSTVWRNKCWKCAERRMSVKTSRGRSDGRWPTRDTCFQLQSCNVSAFDRIPRDFFHSRAAKEDFKWLVYLLCLHHSNNVLCLSFCPKLSDVLVNSKSISFKYDYKAACFVLPPWVLLSGSCPVLSVAAKNCPPPV